MPSRTAKARLFGLAAGAAAVPGLLLAGAGSAAAAPGTSFGKPVPVSAAAKALGLDRGGVLAPSLRKATGTVTVSVAMTEKPIAASVPDGALTGAGLPSKAVQQARTAAVRTQQDRVVGQARGLGAKELGRSSKAANVVALSVDAKRLDAIAAIPGVASVKPVAKYETNADPGGSGSLAQAREYLQANPVYAQGYDGTGVKVAVLDSGVDFTHEYLGGPGTTEAYETCYAQRDVAPSGACAALFGPTAPKVKGGIDFVGENWPNSPEVTDPNPIDFEGHGTHVSDISTGRSADGTHKGMAPGADLYSVKVCSAVSTSCSGVAILEGFDWVLDPNGDGDISDAMDVVNLSLGSSYGQEQDDSSAALNNVVSAGVVVVVSAGNSADRPFIVGSPSTAERSISVAQTALPDDKLYTIVTSARTVPNSKLQSWSPAPTAVITAPLAQPNDVRGCEAADFAAFPAGSIALIQRGTCAASLKAQNAQAAGAVAVIIWNNVPGDPPDFSFGGGAPVTIPTFTISLADGSVLSAAVTAGPVTATIDPAKTTSLTNTVVGTSSRGLTVSGQRAKPDIGAPGAWLSAEVGTGNGQTNFGGTSGAAPVITGAAALLIDKFPLTNPATIKSRLLNGASTANRTPDSTANLYLSPISRVGAGEVRVAPSANAAGVMLNNQVGQGNIGLGLPHLTKTTSYDVQITIRNTGSTSKRYTVAPQFRDPADAAGVKVYAPASVSVPAKANVPFRVRVTIDPSKLTEWPFTYTAGSTGDGSQLNGPEADGWLVATSGSESIHLGWTVLPHRSADVAATSSVTLRNGAGVLQATNRSTVLPGRVSAYALTGTSPKLPKPGAGEPGSPGSNAAIVDLAAAGVLDSVDDDVIEFAIAGHQRQTVPLYPAGYEVDIDVDQDGVVDYAVFQQEGGGFAASGQALVYVLNVATGASSAYYYAGADYDSSTITFPAPLSALGLEAGDTFGFSVLAYDNYFSGAVTDVIDGQTWTVGAPKYNLAGGPFFTVTAGAATRLAVTANPSAGTSTQTGFLLLYGDAATRDYQIVRVS